MAGGGENQAYCPRGINSQTQTSTKIEWKILTAYGVGNKTAFFSSTSMIGVPPLNNDKKMLSNIEFSKDAADYDQSRRYSSLRESYPQIVAEAQSQPFKTVLDIGCGTGSLLMMIHEGKKNAKLFGVDISEEMIRVAQAKLGKAAALTVSDSEKLPFKSGSFDLVLCTFSFHHHPNPTVVFKEMLRVLSPEGRIIMADPSGPTPLMKVMNMLIPFMNDGTVHYYSKKEMFGLAESAKLTVSKWAKLNWHSYVMVAKNLR
jgi:ubiquinone/menaquinone biosynthesis C-methylase UbiE